MTSLDILSLLLLPAGLARFLPAGLARRAGAARSQPSGGRPGAEHGALSDLLEEERQGASRLIALVDRQREALGFQAERIGALERRHVWRDWCLEDLERRLFTMEGAVETCPHCADARAIAECLAERPAGETVVTPFRPRGAGSSDGGSPPRLAG